MKFPKIFQFFRSTMRFLKKPVLVSEKIALQRLETCKKCDFYDSSWGQCQKCTCFVALKVQFLSEDCPIGSWGYSLTTRSLKSVITRVWHKFIRVIRPGKHWVR